MKKTFLTVIGLLVLSATSMAETVIPNKKISLEEQVRQTETAFAQTMVDRNFKDFQSFLSEEAIFLSGKKTLRGITEIAELWSTYYEKAEAPFS